MRIGEVALRAGVTVKAVRHYESLGLIVAARRANGYRDFSEQDVRFVREIRQLGQLGIVAAKTRPFLDCLAAGEEQADGCPSSLAGYRDAIDELTARIEALGRRRAALTERLQQAAYRNSCASPAPAGEDTGMPAVVDHAAAAHLPGRRMPAIALPSTAGGAVRLDCLPPGRSILYLYPLTGRPDVDLPAGWDAIPGARGCTPQACGFRDHHRDLVAAGATRVFGLSSQDSEYQREVVERLRLPYQILSDAGLRLAAALRLPTFRAGELTLYRRLTLVIRDGVVEHAFYPVRSPERHAGEVLDWLRDSPIGES